MITRVRFSLVEFSRSTLILISAWQPGGDIGPRTITLSTSSYHYPVVPNFREWMFPNEKLPGTWTTMAKRRSPGVASTSDAARSRDQCCRMTEAVEETDVAHIVPLAEEVWFNKNDMIRYGNKHASLRPGVNDDANTMLLRADLHRSFDKRRFTFLPKKQGVFVTHVLESESLRDTYHNVELNTNYIAPEYFFARFAWTVLPLLRPFLRRGQRRLLLIHGQPQWADPAECLDLADSSAKSSSASPRKSRSPLKRSWEEIGNELGGQDYTSQNPNDEPALDIARDCPDHHYAKGAKGARRRSLSTPRQNIIAPLLQSHSAPTLPQSCDCVLSPRSVLSSISRDCDTDTTAEFNEHRKAKVARNGVSDHWFDAGKPSDIQSPSSPLGQEDKGPWMAPYQLRAMASSRLYQERERSDPKGLWKEEVKWSESVLRAGGALDSSEIARWSYVNGTEKSHE